MVSPSFARLGFELFDAIVTVVKEGATESTLTLDEFVVAIVGSEVLPAESVPVKEKLTAPLLPDSTV